TGQEIKRFTATTFPYASVAYSPDGKRLAGVSNFFLPTQTTLREQAAKFGLQGGRLSIWDATSGEEVFSVEADFGIRPRLAFSPDPKNPLLAIASGFMKNPELRIWNAASGQLVKTLPGPPGPISIVAFSA